MHPIRDFPLPTMQKAAAREELDGERLRIKELRKTLLDRQLTTAAKHWCTGTVERNNIKAIQLIQEDMTILEAHQEVSPLPNKHPTL